jgi:hypothetical protein
VTDSRCYPLDIPRIRQIPVGRPILVNRLWFTESQVSVDFGGQNETSPEVLDGPNGAHNPKVEGSNPSPATIKSSRNIAVGFTEAGERLLYQSMEL